MILWLTLPMQQVVALTAEGGPIELPTALLYAALGVAMWYRRRPEDPPHVWASLSIIFFAFAAREADWHKAWTSKSVLKLSWYLGPAPLSAKLLAAACILAFAGALLLVLRYHGRTAWQEARQATPWGVAVATFVVTIVVTKIMDRSVNILVEDFGVLVAPGTRVLMGALEECLELSLPLIAAWPFSIGLRPRTNRQLTSVPP